MEYGGASLLQVAQQMTGPRPLPRSMRSLLTGYVENFNRRHRRSGHLLHNRYKSNKGSNPLLA